VRPQLDWLTATEGSVLTSEGVSLSVLTRRRQAPC
jgi:hypothetical protein